MKIAQREREAVRLLTERPGLNIAQLAHLLTVSEVQMTACVLRVGLG